MLVLRAVVGAMLLLLVFGAVATAVLNWWIERRHPASGRFIPVTGGQLHYVEAQPSIREPLGTVVLLHGASSSQGDPMLALGGRLAQHYRVIAFDRPGHGWSDRVGGADAALPSRQAAMIAEALRRLGVRQAVVVGHSWGGSILPNLALDHADVTGAILPLAAVTHPWPGGQITWYYHPAASILGWLFTRTLVTPLGWLFLEPAIAAVFAPQQPVPGYVGQTGVLLALRPSSFRANAQDVAGIYEAVRLQQHRYRDIRLPTVVIGGDADRIVHTDLHARTFAREVPGAKLLVLPGVGHMPHYVAADIIVREIEALAARVQGPDAAQATAP